MADKGKVLVVDDEQDFREDVVYSLKEAGFKVLEAGSGKQALELAEKQILGAALVDLVMPKMNGIELLKGLHRLDPFTRVVILTGQGAVETAVEAMQKGAMNYLTKPVKLDELEVIMGQACEASRLERHNRAHRAVQSRGMGHEITRITARSAAMQDIVRKASALGQVTIPVLIRGETGTGKEVVARLIHTDSDRAVMPLTVLNCAALPDSLIDAELFGHEKGSYTGATDARPGMLEIADGGNLFLDEIGDMPMDAQARLLRFLENGSFRRLGGRVEKKVDVRIMAATNRNLEDAVKDGTFREDLFHRLKGFEIVIPPLRERVEDILPFSDSLLQRRSNSWADLPTLTDQAKRALNVYTWPGNMRELSLTIERAVFVSQLDNTTEITTEHLQLPRAEAVSITLDQVIKSTREKHIAKALRQTNFNRRETAALLGISERQLYRFLEETE